MRESRCRHCQQQIVWAKSMTHDSWMPLDPSPDPGLGTVRRHPVHENGPTARPTIYGEILTGAALHTAIADGELLWIRHRDSCNAFRPHNPKPAHLTLDLGRSRPAARRTR
ncbi:hypothetical protein [Rhodococcus sp. NPDC003348]